MKQKIAAHMNSENLLIHFHKDKEDELITTDFGKDGLLDRMGIWFV